MPMSAHAFSEVTSGTASSNASSMLQIRAKSKQINMPPGRMKDEEKGAPKAARQN